MYSLIKQELQKTRELVSEMIVHEALLQTAEQIANCCVHSLKQGGKVLFAGNGGSAADSQHLAAELVCRLSYNRPAIAAMALTTDTSALTAIANDFSFEYLFARQVEALGRAGDILIGISTSGQSANILRALEAARSKGLIPIGFSGQAAPKMRERCDFVLNIPSSETPKIQEGHIIVGHIICAVIEDLLYGAEYNSSKVEQFKLNNA
ncbi:MAG TPA: D-sedoheptulose 7-phosphate isomerase [Gammaproteobacteria bacterium]|nr:D-sedoheptulose 7-phosphate isomerase [Gammaproteobacteria bacterium]